MNTQIKFVIDIINNNKDKIKSVLNIGYRIGSDSTIQNFCESNNIKWSVLEAFKPNCEMLINAGAKYEIINGDAKNISYLNKNFDLIIWLHGPEHVEWNDFLQMRSNIEKKSNFGVIYQAPIGFYPQDEIYGNPYEKHLATLVPEMFETLGYKTKLHKNSNENTFSAFILNEEIYTNG